MDANSSNRNMKSEAKSIDRTELLASTRTEFLASFVSGLASSLPQSVEALFTKADRSPSSIAQRRFLDARGILQNHFEDFQLQMRKSMEKMLNRSFQTTYSNYRPAFPTSILDGSISLVDTSVFEDELRLNEITDRFRNEAGEQLRDLNIRIALLFEQDNIKERENPFRPYLFSRTIATAVEGLGTSADLNTVLAEQLAENFSDHVAAIYEDVNAHLAQHGIAAQLMFKPTRSPNQPPASPNKVDADGGRDERDYADHQRAAPVRNSPWNNPQDIDNRGFSTDVPQSPVERLLKSVKAMASKSPGQHGDVSGGTDNGIQGGGVAGGGSYGPGSGTSQQGNVGGQYGGGASPGGEHYSGPSGGTIQDGVNYGGNSGGNGGGNYGSNYGGNNNGGGNGNNSGGNNGSGGGSAGAQHTGGQDGNPSLNDGAAENPQYGGPSNAGGNEPTNANWLSGNQGVGEFLRKFFSGKSRPDDFAGNAKEQFGGESGKARPAIGQLAGSVQTLLRESTPRTEEMYASNGEIRNLIMERRANLSEDAHDLREQMTIDIVSMLFEFILRDTQVPAEVRAQLGRLQFLVLKVALRDESLLTEKAHPARMLVNRIGSISLGLKQIDPSGANVTAEICRIVAEMLADDTENPGLFSKMLDDLDKFIAHELLVNDKSVSSAVEVVEQAESRTLRFAHTTAQMSEALSGLTINEHLKQFLENDWARAIERAERTDAELAIRYRLLVPDLLWSVLPKVTEEDRQQLLVLLPVILKTIHGGMNAVGWAAADKQTLMDWLFDAHTVVLRGNSANGSTTSLASIHQHFSKFVEHTEKSPQTQPVTVTVESQKSFLEEAMRDLDVRIQLLDKLFEEDKDLQEDDSISDADPQPELSITERLRIGVGIEINLGGKPSIGRLNWFNPNATNLVLTLNDQADPSMISVRMFHRLLNHDRVRFLETEPIFERAVESLLISANQIA